jgi:hypothetical protein
MHHLLALIQHWAINASTNFTLGKVNKFKCMKIIYLRTVLGGKSNSSEKVLEK